MNEFVSLMSFPVFGFKEEMEKTVAPALKKGCGCKVLTCLILIQSKINFDPVVLLVVPWGRAVGSNQNITVACK